MPNKLSEIISISWGETTVFLLYTYTDKMLSQLVFFDKLFSNTTGSGFCYGLMIGFNTNPVYLN